LRLKCYVEVEAVTAEHATGEVVHVNQRTPIRDGKSAYDAEWWRLLAPQQARAATARGELKPQLSVDGDRAD
jgi:hypothetical protein